MSNKDEKLAKIAADDSGTYINRKLAMEAIKDDQLINRLAETAKDEWIRLESAIVCNNRRVLKELKYHKDERIQIEAAIELNDQKSLASIVLKSTDFLHRNRALNHIINKKILREIVERCRFEKERVEIALRLRDQEITKKLIPKIKDERFKLQMAESVHDTDTINNITWNASDNRIRQFASEWLSVLKRDSDID